MIREKRLEDAPADYQWRVDEELSSLDATSPLRMSYASYLRIYEDELRHPVPWSKRYAVDALNGKMIGNCMYYDINTPQGEAELGIMIGDKDYWNQGYGSDVVNTFMAHIFTATPLSRIYLHTLTWNNRAQKSFEKCGFIALKQVRRSGYDFILMELRKERWEARANGSSAQT